MRMQHLPPSSAKDSPPDRPKTQSQPSPVNSTPQELAANFLRRVTHLQEQGRIIPEETARPHESSRSQPIKERSQGEHQWMKIEAEESSELLAPKNWLQHAFHKKMNTYENESGRLKEKEKNVFMKTNRGQEYLSQKTLNGNKFTEQMKQEIINEDFNQSASFELDLSKLNPNPPFDFQYHSPGNSISFRSKDRGSDILSHSREVEEMIAEGQNKPESASGSKNLKGASKRKYKNVQTLSVTLRKSETSPFRGPNHRTQKFQNSLMNLNELNFSTSNKKKRSRSRNQAALENFEQRKMGEVTQQYTHRRIKNKSTKIYQQFSSCINVLEERRVGNISQYLWKLGNVKIFMTIEEASVRAFEVYYRQLKKYKNAVKRHVGQPEERMKAFLKIGTNKKSKREQRVEDEDSSYMRELKLIFNDVLFEKCTQFSKMKKFKAKIEKDREIEIKSEDELFDSNSQSDYIPNVPEVVSIVETAVQRSNKKIRDKFYPKALKINTNSFSMVNMMRNLKKEQEEGLKNAKRSAGKSGAPLDAKVTNYLSTFQEDVHLVNGVHKLVGGLSQQCGKLSCLEGGLRSSHRIQELSREDYIQELVALHQPIEDDVIEIETPPEPVFKMQIFK